MPYICIANTNVADGTVQVIDLKPNVSQMSDLDGPGQTRYANRVTSDTVTVLQPDGGGEPIFISKAGGSAESPVQGLAAYLLANCADGAGQNQPMTADIANDSAAAIIALVDGGSDVDLGAINGAIQGTDANAACTLTTGNSSGSVADVLDILSGRVYQIDNETQIHTTELAGAFDPAGNGAAGSFTKSATEAKRIGVRAGGSNHPNPTAPVSTVTVENEGIRTIYASGSLRVSYSEGSLSTDGFGGAADLNMQPTPLAGTAVAASPTLSGEVQERGSYPVRSGGAANRGHIGTGANAPLTQVSGGRLISVYDDDGTCLNP